MLEGVRVRELKKVPDERGFFCETFREDWRDFFEKDRIVQSNFSLSYPGIVRAWHRHSRGQVDYFVVLRGALRICAYDDRPDSTTRAELSEIVSSGEKLQMVRMPGYYWHGFKVLGNESSLLVYFVNCLYDYQKPDEERRPWNDPNILDPKTKQAYDWNKPPFQ
jgi:dTDP-4-dehydrorhamnose 3,5-epimerase